MAFVAGRSVVLGVGATVALPTMVDVAGCGYTYPLYSHMRVPGGTTYTFSDGTVHVVPASTDTVLAIPQGATSVVATAASTCQFGQMLS
jgi:hypothetical protein